jgi:hypothetical protein
MRRTLHCAAAAAASATYRPGQYHMINGKSTVGRKLVGKRNPNDKNATEMSHRTLRPQPHQFEIPVASPSPYAWRNAAWEFQHVEKALITTAFDTPEAVAILLRDLTVEGYKGMYSEKWLDAALHWVKEARYWRCIGIHKPFYGNHALRAYAWADHNTSVGTVHFSAAMIDAVKDMERAVKRKDAGLAPNYVWDRWGPMGFIDGGRTDHLPRMRHNPHVDPDGIEVTRDDIADLTAHETIRERFHEIIFPDAEQFAGAFLAPTNGGLTFADLDADVQDLFLTLHGVDPAGASRTPAAPLSPDDVRALVYAAALPELLTAMAASGSWAAALELVQPLRASHDGTVEAARALHNASREIGGARSYYEEKCGFADFMATNDKTITGAVLAYLADMKTVLAAESGAALAAALTDSERHAVMGDAAFNVWRTLEDLALGRRQRLWATRFAGAANEEKTLDFMLNNFARRPERPSSVNSPGAEFDREVEPIGRKVQRRVLESDKAVDLSGNVKKKSKFQDMVKKGKTLNPYASLHENQFASGQMSNFMN